MANHNYYAYILECSDESYYVGVTSDLEIRLLQHETGYFPTCYTYKRRPVILKYFELFKDVNQAISREKQIKGWSKTEERSLICSGLGCIG